MNDSDAQNWARTVDADSANPAMIERTLLRDRPDIVRLIDASVAEAKSADTRRPEASPAAGAAGIVAAVFAVAGLFAPIAGAVLSIPDFSVLGDISVAQKLSLIALCFTISVVALAGASIVWLFRGAHRSAPLRALGVVAVVGGAISTALLPTLAAEDGVEFTPWNLPGVVALVVGILATGAALVRWKSVAQETAESASERLRTAVAALPADTRRAMIRERAAALDVLVTRGIITHESREQRRSMPLGAVAILDETLRERGT